MGAGKGCRIVEWCAGRGEYFQTLGLDVWDAWTFFKLLDKDNGGAVEVEEFLMGCLRLRGQASAMDVGRIINDQTWLIKTQGTLMANSFFQALCASLGSLSRVPFLFSICDFMRQVPRLHGGGTETDKGTTLCPHRRAVLFVLSCLVMFAIVCLAEVATA